MEKHFRLILNPAKNKTKRMHGSVPISVIICKSVVCCSTMSLRVYPLGDVYSDQSHTHPLGQ